MAAPVRVPVDPRPPWYRPVSAGYRRAFWITFNTIIAAVLGAVFMAGWFTGHAYSHHDVVTVTNWKRDIVVRPINDARARQICKAHLGYDSIIWFSSIPSDYEISCEDATLWDDQGNEIPVNVTP